MKKGLVLILVLLVLTGTNGLTQESARSIRDDHAEGTLSPPAIADLQWVSLLVPRRNISAGELLHEEDFDQGAVGYREGEDMHRFIQANFAVEGKYAAVDLYTGRTIDVGSIVEQPPPHTAQSKERGFADELAWFSYEYLQPGTIAPGFRLQMKRIRRDSIPSGALPPDFKPPGRFKVLSGISLEHPVLADQIESVEEKLNLGGK